LRLRGANWEMLAGTSRSRADQILQGDIRYAVFNEGTETWDQRAYDMDVLDGAWQIEEIDVRISGIPELARDDVELRPGSEHPGSLGRGGTVASGEFRKKLPKGIGGTQNGLDHRRKDHSQYHMQGKPMLVRFVPFASRLAS